MSDLVARTGRHQQHYEDGYRLIAGCVPLGIKVVTMTLVPRRLLKYL